MAFFLGILLLSLSGCFRPKPQPALDLQACKDDKETMWLRVYLLEGQVKDLENRLVVEKEALRTAKGGKP